ncbi:type II toxin-antitoxin system RelE/ParE family toxin [Algoriphagus sp.]|jgi:hypothetical protein|uniref:type II toxin-antitoxin system RelE/ParE family toxin n=1 Tax=Algoriphagus sp. TaxID=1872435 RepID=UPI002720A849|nr:type II toxin-antitoxin system RelE/ParE family toxin [Algoriphagus sp.]MDO8968724.1 type II toxin-antitoxin system RelE/ParE family toxin [Algoriphagus sp.]MDP3199358.1 type II toxin-antitoxin system RelE/ParE family toxin [Algoriphagus sp.]
MKLELILKEEARLEIIDAYQYYESAKVGLGEIFLTHLDKCFDRMLAQPQQFPMKRAPYREAAVTKFPFLIIFELQEKSIIVYSVFNTWRNPEKKPGEIS